MNRLIYITALLILSACGLIAGRKSQIRPEIIDDNRAKKIALFGESVYPHLRAQCIECHRQNIQPLIASDSLEESFTNALQYVDAENMPDSVLITQTINGHCGRAACVTDGTDMMRVVVHYLDAVKDLELTNPPSTKTPSTTFPLRTAELSIPNAVFSDDEFHMMTFDVSSIDPLLVGATLEVEVQQFDPTTYMLQRPRLNTGTATVRIQNLKILMNGSYDSANNHFTGVNRVVGANSGLYLSTQRAIIATDKGQGDTLGFAIESVTLAAMPTFDLTGLLAFWKLDEASGLRMDSVGTVHLPPLATPAPTAFPSNTAGIAGKALQLNRTNRQHLSATGAVAAPIGFNATSFSTSGWFYLDNATTQAAGLWGKGSSGSGLQENQEWVLSIQSNPAYGLTFSTSNGLNTGNCSISLGYNASFVPKRWYFIVAWYDASAQTVNLQVNTDAPQSSTCTTGLTNRGFGFSVSRMSDTYIDGRMDSIGVWSRVLSSTERANLYNGGLGTLFPF